MILGFDAVRKRQVKGWIPSKHRTQKQTDPFAMDHGIVQGAST